MLAFLPREVYTQKDKIVKDRPVDPVAGLPPQGGLQKKRRSLKIARSILLLAFLPGEAYVTRRSVKDRPVDPVDGLPPGGGL